MAEMTVKMNLTLADVASPGFRSFMALIETLGPKVTGLNNRLTTLTSSLTKAGAAAETVATKTAAASASVTSLETTLASATGIANVFETSMRNLTQMLTIAERVANGLVSSYNNLGVATATAGRNAAGAAGGFNAASSGIQNLNTHVRTLTHSIEGMMQLWAASKIKQGLGHVVDEAAAFQTIQTRMAAFNFSKEENEVIEKRSRDLSAKLPFISPSDALKSYGGAIAGLGHNDPKFLAQVMEPALKVALIARNRGDTSDVEDVVRNLFGLVEARGQTSNPDAAIKTFDMVQRILTVTQSKVTIKDLETVFRQIKGGFGFEISDDGMLAIAEIANQLKASGSGGGGGGGGMGVAQAGTGTTQALKTIMMGVVNKQTAHKLMKMGLLDPAKVQDTGDSAMDVFAGPTAFAHSQEIIENPIAGINKYLGPAFLKYVQDNKDKYYEGRPLSDAHAEDRAIARLINEIFGGKGGVNVTQLVSQAINPRAFSRIEAGVQTAKASKGVDTSVVDLLKTYKVASDQAMTSIEALSTTIGSTLLGALTSVMDTATQFVRWLDELAKENLAVTRLAAITAALIAISLAISGFQKIFGIWAVFQGWLTAAAVTAPVAATGVTGFFTALQIGLSRAIPLLLVFTSAFAIGTWISDLDIGGKTISDWFGTFIGGIVTIVQNGWIRTKAFLGLITEAEKEAALKESNAKYVAGTGGPTTWETELAKSRAQRTSSGKIGGLPAHDDHPPLSEVERSKRQAAADALKNMKDDGFSTSASKHFFNPAASALHQEAKVAVDNLAVALKELSRQYKASSLSATAYYDQKRDTIERYSKIEITALEKELQSLKNPIKGKVDQAAVDRVGTQLKMAQNKEENALLQVEADRKRDLLQIDNLILDVERKSDAIEGRRHTAEIKRLEQDIEKRRAVLAANLDRPGAKEAFDRLPGIAESAKANIIYSDEKAALSVKIDALQQKEKQIANEVTAGTKEQYIAEEQIYRLRQEEGRLMDEFIEKYREMAEMSKDPKLIKDVQEMVTVSKGLLSTLGPEATKVKSSLEGGMSTFLQNSAHGIKNLRQELRALFDTIVNSLNKIAADAISQSISKALFGGTGGSGAQGFGTGIIGKGLDFLGDTFAGPAASFAAFDTGVTGSFATDLMSGLIPLAAGTTDVPQDMAAQLHKGEIVVPPNMAQGIRDGSMTLGGGKGVTLNATFNVPPYVDQRSQGQIAAATAGYLNRYMKRNG